MKRDNPLSSPSETPTANQSNSTPPAAALRASSPPRTRRSKAPAPRQANAAAAGPDAIALRAYQLFEARNWQHGFDVDDWLRAEAELTAPAPQKRRAARRSPQS
jgi:hypothetical protein